MNKYDIGIRIAQAVLSIGFVPLFRIIRKARRYKRLEKAYIGGKINTSKYMRLKKQLDEEYSK